MSCCCFGGGGGQQPRTKEDEQLSVDLQRMHQREVLVQKLLLLGTGECGKSTILKQMQIISGTGFSESELLTCIESVHANIVEALQSLVRCCEVQGIPWLSRESDEWAATLHSMPAARGQVFPSAELLQVIRHFWVSEQDAMQRAIATRSFPLLDSAVYFLNSAERCFAPNYRPTNDDVLRVRLRTTGVHEFQLQFDKEKFSFIDVGGQRGERKKCQQTH